MYHCHFGYNTNLKKKNICNDHDHIDTRPPTLLIHDTFPLRSNPLWILQDFVYDLGAKISSPSTLANLHSALDYEDSSQIMNLLREVNLHM